MDKNKKFKKFIKDFLFKAISLKSKNFKDIVYKVNLNFIESGFDINNYTKHKK